MNFVVQATFFLLEILKVYESLSTTHWDLYYVNIKIKHVFFLDVCIKVLLLYKNADCSRTYNCTESNPYIWPVLLSVSVITCCCITHVLSH